VKVEVDVLVVGVVRMDVGGLEERAVACVTGLSSCESEACVGLDIAKRYNVMTCGSKWRWRRRFGDRLALGKLGWWGL
jgi:hypothetical protein